MTEPHPEGRGITLSIENALADAGVAREEINYVNAHATSTQSGDLKEYEAIVRCFGQNPQLRVNSTKSMTGHLIGAAGGIEAVASIQAIRTGWVHPNLNLENPENIVDVGVLVGPQKERCEVNVALSNSFGFGGTTHQFSLHPSSEHGRQTTIFVQRLHTSRPAYRRLVDSVASYTLHILHGGPS